MFSLLAAGDKSFLLLTIKKNKNVKLGYKISYDITSEEITESYVFLKS